MRILKKIISKYPRLKETLKVAYQCWKDGGFVPVEVSQISYGKLLTGKNILITGGSAGIGKEIAKKCIKEGAQVVITGRNPEKLLHAKNEINSHLLHTMIWDVSDVNIVSEMVNKACGLLKGEIDILVNNAGYLSVNEAFPNITESNWDRTYSTNSKGLFFLIQEVAKKWKNQIRCTPKKIINISSSGSILAANNPYRMTKWDVAGFTQALGYMLSKEGIIVNAIAPGRTSTDMLGYGNVTNYYDTKQPLRRLGLPEEIAELALFLMSNASNYIVGQTIVCDGGYSLKV